MGILNGHVHVLSHIQKALHRAFASVKNISVAQDKTARMAGHAGSEFLSGSFEFVKRDSYGYKHLR